MNRKLQGIGAHSCIFGFLTFVLVSSSFGQSSYGSFVGTVRDPSGGVVAECTVTIQNTGTGLLRTTRTNQSGSYEFVNVDPGTYKISMQSSGFQEAVYNALVLEARQTIRMDASLVLGT